VCRTDQTERATFTVTTPAEEVATLPRGNSAEDRDPGSVGLQSSIWTNRPLDADRR